MPVRSTSAPFTTDVRHGRPDRRAILPSNAGDGKCLRAALRLGPDLCALLAPATCNQPLTTRSARTPHPAATAHAPAPVRRDAAAAAARKSGDFLLMPCPSGVHATWPVPVLCRREIRCHTTLVDSGEPHACRTTAPSLARATPALAKQPCKWRYRGLTPE